MTVCLCKDICADVFCDRVQTSRLLMRRTRMQVDLTRHYSTTNISYRRKGLTPGTPEIITSLGQHHQFFVVLRCAGNANGNQPKFLVLGRVRWFESRSEEHTSEL